MNKVIFLALVVFLWPSFLVAEVPAPTLQSDTIALVPLDSGQVAGQIPVWDGEQWVFVNPGVQGDQFKVDSVGSPSWENSGPTEGYDVGCLDPGACNYMPAAAISFPAMCDYLSCKGCTDEQYLEYSEQALIDDGSCATKLGCLDPDADNFDPEAEGTDGSCTYSGIELAYIGEEDVLPTNLLLFELFMQDEDSLYDDIRFYVDGVLEQDTGRYMTWIVGYQPFEVHATALFEGAMRYSDTLLFDPYVSVSQVPIIFDVPIDPDTWLGEGISLVSTVDSLFVSYAQILDQSALELTCDFSSGPDFVVGTVADGDSAKWFSMTYLEAVDTLTISCAKTVTALTMLMPDLAKEEETILNFVEETIPSTTQFDSLVTAFSSQIQNSGALSLSALDYVHLNQTASELKAQLPEVALLSGECPGIGSGLFEWPTLMADDEINGGRALKYDNCGSDLSYAVQAKSNLVGGGVRTSKTYVFSPELKKMGSLYWKIGGESLPGYVESEHRLIPAFDRSRLTPEDFGLNPDAHATTSITVKTYGAGVNAVNPSIEDPALSGALIQGPLPPFSPGHDVLSHVLDAVVPWPDCGLSGLMPIDNEVNAILASPTLSDEEKTELIRSYLLDQAIPLIESAVKSKCGPVDVAKFAAWTAGVTVSAGLKLVVKIELELASYALDKNYSQSYVTHQLVTDGVFLGTPIADVDEGFVLASGQPVEPVSGTAYSNVTEPDPYQTAFSSPWYKGDGLSPLLEHERMDEKDFAPGIRFHPFVAYHQDGSLLQWNYWDQGWGSEFGSLFMNPDLASHFGLQVSVPFGLNTPFSSANDGVFVLNVKEEANPPVSSVYGGLCSPSAGGNYLQRPYGLEPDALNSPKVPRLRGSLLAVPFYGENLPFWNGLISDSPVHVGKVNLKYEPGVLVNGVFEALPDFPNRFAPNATEVPLSPVVGLPMVVTHDVHGVKAFMQGEDFLLGSEYPLPYPGTTVFRDTVDGLTAEFSLRFSPDEISDVEAPLYAELTGIPSGVNVETVGSCNGCVVSQDPLRVRLDGLGKSPVDFKLDFSDVDMEEDGLDFDIDVWLTTDCDAALGTFEKRLHLQPSIQGCEGETSVQYGGYDYSIVGIGDQCWFAENLRTMTYADGTAIPEVTDEDIWVGLSSGASCVYDNNAGNLSTYGRLYNWYAVDDERGLCPAGWHVPTSAGWMELKNHITSQGFDGVEGTALKSTTGWSNGGNGTDEFGFTALPGGSRSCINGTFCGAGNSGKWWNTGFNGSNGCFYGLGSSFPSFIVLCVTPEVGLSVRCLRDAE